MSSSRMRGPEWYSVRSTGIGGSEAAAAMGISPFKTRLRLYMEKIGQVEPEDISAEDYVYFGTMLEPIVIAEYCRRFDCQIIKPRKLYRSRRRRHAIANVDFRQPFLRGRLKIIGEAKTVGMFAYIAKEWGADGSPIIPVEYYAQAQHNIEVVGADQCDVPVLIGGQQFKTFRCPRDPEFVAKMIEEEDRFWNCVQNKIEPPPTTADDLLLKFPTHTPGLAKDATVRIAQAYGRLCRADARIAKQKVVVDAAKFKIQEFMGDAESLLFNGEEICTWRKGEKSRRFLFERPDDPDADEAPKKRTGHRPRGASKAIGVVDADDVNPAADANAAAMDHSEAAAANGGGAL